MPNVKPQREKAVASSGRLCLARLAVCVLWLVPAALRAQATNLLGPDTSAVSDTTPRLVRGRVVRPSARDTSNVEGVAGIWVTLHRVGSDTAGPLDSMRTGAGGSYAFHYRHSGRADAIYFVSASYASIAYFSLPLLTPRVTGDSAEITVYDTTSRSFGLTVRGRHVIVGQPNVDGSHEIIEVYEITNDSGITLLSRDDAHPTWTALLPAGAIGFSVGQSDISPRAVRAVGGRVEVVAPMAPGLKQLSFSYRVPAKSFPLSIPMTYPVGVLEVLAEDPRATVSGPKLKRAEPVSISGRNFSRYVGEDVPANAVLQVDAPSGTDASRQQRYFLYIAIAIAATMLIVLAFVLARRRAPRPAIVGHPASPVDGDAEQLAREIAALDARFEQQANPSAAERAAYERERDGLKQSLARALDARRTHA
ncbi:MAG TPA: hypothetical protein VJO52_06335 [Gemmatimonadaceae bacterium]|nr:hypothetical protein [Gemmatimonadaceae bacterium]